MKLHDVFHSLCSLVLHVELSFKTQARALLGRRSLDQRNQLSHGSRVVQKHKLVCCMPLWSTVQFWPQYLPKSIKPCSLSKTLYATLSCLLQPSPLQTTSSAFYHHPTLFRAPTLSMPQQHCTLWFVGGMQSLATGTLVLYTRPSADTIDKTTVSLYLLNGNDLSQHCLL